MYPLFALPTTGSNVHNKRHMLKLLWLNARSASKHLANNNPLSPSDGFTLILLS